MRKTIHLIVILFFFCTQTYSQEAVDSIKKELDSLLQLTITERVDSIRAKLYLEIVQQLRFTQPDSAQVLCTKSVIIADRILSHNNLSEEDSTTYLNIKAKAIFESGVIDQMHSKLDLAKDKFEQASELFVQVNNQKDLGNLYNYLSRIYESKGNGKKFFYYTQEAYHIQIARNDSLGQAMSLIAFGSYYERQGAIDSSLQNYQSSIILLRRIARYGPLSYGLSEYAHTLMRQERYKEAINVLYELLELNDNQGKLYQKTITLRDMGTMFYQMNEYDKAIEHLEKALINSRKMKNLSIEAGLLSKLAVTFSKKKNHKKSLNLHLSAYELRKRGDFIPSVLAINLNNIGKQYLYLDSLPKSLFYLEQALDVGTEGLLPKTLATLLNNLGEVRMKLNRLSQAEINAKKAYMISQSISAPRSEMKASSTLHQLYKKRGQHELSLKYLERFSYLSDSLNKINHEAILAKKESEFQLNKKEQEIKELEGKREIQSLMFAQRDIELKSQRQVLLLLLLGLSLMLCLAFIIFYRYHLKRKSRELSLQTKQLKLERHQEKALRQIELAKAKDDLFTDISHEFRTPLTLIQVRLKILMKDAHESSVQILQSMLRNTSHLIDMVDGILDLAKLKSDKIQLHYSTIDITELLATIKSDFAPLFDKKAIQLQCNSSLHNSILQADRNRLKMVLNNLLKNALHHCPMNGNVKLEVLNSESDDASQMIIKVINDVSASKIPITKKVFERYYRGINETYKGNGLGLAITKQIVMLHQGKIDVSSNTCDQIIFSVELPMKSGKEINRDPQRIIERNHVKDYSEMPFGIGNNNDAKPRVLIVDDNLEMRLLLEEILKSEFDLILAENGEVGELLVRDRHPSIIISDIMMPQKDGFEFLQSLKQNIKTSHIPVILLSARADKDSRIKGLMQDADDYIIKPFDPDELLARIQNLLRQRNHLHTLFKNNPFLNVDKVETSLIDRNFLKSALMLVEENYHNGDYTVEQFCSNLMLNRSSVHNKLKALINQNASQLIQNFRLQKAAKELIETEHSIENIIYDCGFNSRQSFYSAFKKKFGETPKVFRISKS